MTSYCLQERSSLLKTLGTLKDLEIRSLADSNDLEEPVSSSGLETFSLGYKVCYYSFLSSF